MLKPNPFVPGDMVTLARLEKISLWATLIPLDDEQSGLVRAGEAALVVGLSRFGTFATPVVLVVTQSGRFGWHPAPSFTLV